MNTNRSSKKEVKKGVINDMYGIFVDYLIDTNQFMAIDGPVYNYENFQAWNKWEVAKIVVDGKAFLIVDIDLKPFSYCRYIGYEKSILKAGLNSKSAVAELKAYSKLLGIDILNQMEFYLNGNPNNIQTNLSTSLSTSFSSVDIPVITLSPNDKWIIVKMKTDNGYEVAMVRDFDGYIDEEEEELLDGTKYTEEEADKKVDEYCRELGLKRFNLFQYLNNKSN